MKNHILSKNLIIGLLLLTTIFSWSFPNLLVKSEVLGLSYSIRESEFVDRVNLIRSKNGLPPFNLSNKLSVAANQKANDMVATNYWGHISPGGIAPWHFISKNNYRYVYAGENLARGYTNLNEVFDAWMNSETHRKNILSKNFKDTGFAIITGNVKGENTTIIVEMFASSN